MKLTILTKIMCHLARGKLEESYIGTGWVYAQLDTSPKVVAVCFQGQARCSRRVRRRFACGSREISLVPSLYIEHLPTLLYTHRIQDMQQVAKDLLEIHGLFLRGSPSLSYSCQTAADQLSEKLHTKHLMSQAFLLPNTFMTYNTFTHQDYCLR